LFFELLQSEAGLRAGRTIVRLLFLLLSIIKLDHHAVKEVRVSNQQTKVMVSSACLLSQLFASGRSNVVSLGEMHLPLLLQ
jgi:hypothetical protein